MAIVASTYFKGVIRLDYSKAATVEKLGYYSDYCEELYLKKLLGEIEYYKYVADKALQTHAQKYTDLLTAKTFEYAGITYKNDILQMLAYFIYFEYQQDSNGVNTVMGEQQVNTENSTLICPERKLVRAYNLGIDLYNVAQYYLSIKTTDFPAYNSENLYKINSFGI